MSRPPWWRGERGEWYVVIQVGLMILVFLGPRSVLGWPVLPFSLVRLLTAVGAALMVLGGTLMVAALLTLGRGLTPLPYPRDDSTLVRTGPYALVRHPMYGGGLMLAFGWALVVQGPLTVVYVALLLALFEVKSSREERWLVQKFPDYVEYQRRVPKLIPFVH